MDVDLDITDDLDVYVEEDNNNNLDAKEEVDNNIDVLCVQTFQNDKPAQPYRHHREEKSLIGHNLC